MPWLALFVGKLDKFAAGFQRLAQRAAQINSRSAPHGLPTPAGVLCETFYDAARQVRYLLQFIVTESSEVFFAARLNVARSRHLKGFGVSAARAGPILEKKSEPPGRAFWPKRSGP